MLLALVAKAQPMFCFATMCEMSPDLRALHEP